MGLRLFSSSTNCKPEDPCNYTLVPNPNPYRFHILECEQINGNVAVMINYIDCTTYKGNKVLVYENTTIEELMENKYLDPHFIDSDDGNIYPIARFTGDKCGFENAIKFLRTK